MPELPEVEAMRHLVEKHCGGRTITKVIAADDSKVFADGCSPKMVTALTNRKLVGAVRKGKWLLLEFQSENLKCTVALHCGMTGSLVVRGVPAFQYKEFVVHDEVWPPRFCKLELEFGGVSLAFTDPRRFGRIHLVDDPGAFAPVVALGWDMLTAPPTLEQFSQGLAKRSGPIKGVLLDQSFTAGVGNYIADEGLYQARLHPAHPANQLTPEQQSTLLKQLVHVIATASAVGADAGRFPSDWLFHFRWAKRAQEAKDACGHVISFETVAGRTSAVVTAMQKRPPSNKTSRKRQDKADKTRPAKSQRTSAPAIQRTSTLAQSLRRTDTTTSKLRPI
mmetsp:Transcript_4745/g.10390  ORF Transcript_4745/g.10390 Transcript_4745/m.10390 type:complete len:335 (+) Transcript_4745:38-1042(+)